MADAFYKFMFRQKHQLPDYRDTAKGVFHIAKALRTKRPKAVPLDRWVNFVHVGA